MGTLVKPGPSRGTRRARFAGQTAVAKCAPWSNGHAGQTWAAASRDASSCCRGTMACTNLPRHSSLCRPRCPNPPPRPPTPTHHHHQSHRQLVLETPSPPPPPPHFPATTRGKGVCGRGLWRQGMSGCKCPSTAAGGRSSPQRQREWIRHTLKRREQRERHRTLGKHWTGRRYGIEAAI